MTYSSLHHLDDEPTRVVAPHQLAPLLAECTTSDGVEIDIPIEVTTLVIDNRGFIGPNDLGQSRRRPLRSTLDERPSGLWAWHLVPGVVGFVMAATVVTLGLWLVH